MLRSTDEADSIAGDKLEGSIHEVEQTDIDADGHVTKQKEGTLTPTNPSEYIASTTLTRSCPMLPRRTSKVVVSARNSSQVKSTVEYTASDRNKAHDDRRRTPTLQDRAFVSPGRGGEHHPLEIDAQRRCLDLHDVVVLDLPGHEYRKLNTPPSKTVSSGTLAPSPPVQPHLVVRGTLSTDGKEPISSGSAVATYRADAAFDHEFRRPRRFPSWLRSCAPSRKSGPTPGKDCGVQKPLVLCG